MVQALWKTVWQYFKKLNIELPFHLAIPLLDIDQKKLKQIFMYKIIRECW